ncbi:hypothetical protein QA640_44030 (plasmid) [Bradyrhizobium sp. CB82]|uniref:hypothetical protein n=1 Tax=Bradyrhizobium sp. CB82 TaxID=3039159 RepID=UPI0024B24624|nr:hypothetical protein [Bradyrhizobium sp. CB82]WFU45807.1 hypothetical protein QA640_44030 [Bradyrhizobium sp. CB82]
MSTLLSIERRQAATPAHKVRNRAVASKSIETNWLTRTCPEIQSLYVRASTDCRFEKCRCADAPASFPQLAVGERKNSGRAPVIDLIQKTKNPLNGQAGADPAGRDPAGFSVDGDKATTSFYASSRWSPL